MHFILIYIAFFSFFTPKYKESVSNAVALSSQDSKLTADDRVDSGLFIVKPHIVSKLPSQKSIHLINSLTLVDKIKYAINEFEQAVRRKEQLSDFTLAQVYAYLADSYQMLGIELFRLNMSKINNKKTLGKDSKKAYEHSAFYYKKALNSSPGLLEYTLAKELVLVLIMSNKNDQALLAIQDFEKKKLTPEKGVEHALIRLKAEILIKQGKTTIAALTYEEWINRGSAQDIFINNIKLYERLKNLKQLTGHPSNLDK